MSLKSKKIFSHAKIILLGTAFVGAAALIQPAIATAHGGDEGGWHHHGGGHGWDHHDRGYHGWNHHGWNHYYYPDHWHQWGHHAYWHTSWHPGFYDVWGYWHPGHWVRWWG